LGQPTHIPIFLILILLFPPTSQGNSSKLVGIYPNAKASLEEKEESFLPSHHHTVINSFPTMQKEQNSAFQYWKKKKQMKFLIRLFFLFCLCDFPLLRVSMGERDV